MMRFLSGLVLAAAALGASAQSLQVAEARRHQAAAVAAYKARDYATYLAECRRAAGLRPGHQSLLFNLAGALALNGKADESLALLERIAGMGLDVPFEREDDLSAVRSLRGFTRVAAAFARNRQPLGSATVALTFPVKGLITEAVERDPRTGTFFISSVRERKILAVAPGGDVTTFAGSSAGLWSVLGMKIDARRRLLWAVTTAMPQMNEKDPDAEGTSAVVAFDLESKRLVQRVELPPSGNAKRSFGDLVLDSAGNVYVSDSGSPAVYVLRRSASTLETLTADPSFVNLQGIALDEKRQRLYVADYSVGIWQFDLESRRLRLLASADEVSLLGIDGLYLDGRNLVAVQNGVRPHRVVRIELDRRGSKATRTEVLAANLPQFDEPTLGTISEGAFYFIANSQWGAFGENGEVKNAATLKDPVVLKVDLAVDPRKPLRD